LLNNYKETIDEKEIECDRISEEESPGESKVGQRRVMISWAVGEA